MTVDSQKILVDRCREAGLRMTAQRSAIFACLVASEAHLSAEEVFRALQPQYPMLSQATVYNTLETLTRLGVIREIQGVEMRRRYDARLDPHCHAVCRYCRAILDVPQGDPPCLSPAQQRVLDAAGFRVDETRLALTGACSRCATAASSADAIRGRPAQSVAGESHVREGSR